LTGRLPELRERLAEMNIRLERFDVEWRGAAAQGHSPSFAQQGNSGGRSAWDHAPRGNGGRPSAVEGATAPLRSGVQHRGDLDVVV
jgi:hypothetical protein